jgi:PadR family transcriptional regulator PadR
MTKDMREPTFVILTALVPAPRHGYAIITDAFDLSGGTVVLQPGTLYAALDRLRQEGLVAVDHEEVVQGRLRRYFALTDAGTTALSKEALRRETVTTRSLNRLRAAGTVLPT